MRATEIADYLTSDDAPTGIALAKELRERFGTTTREDWILGVTLAWTCQQAGWLADICELEGLKKSTGAPA